MSFHREPYTFVGQVNIKVQNLERSLAFYQEIIGFKVLEQSEGFASLTADGNTVLLTIEQPKQVVPKLGKTTGLYHFAILLPERIDLARMVFHLSELGIPFGSSDHLVSEALYLSDPEGNGIEIYIDRSPSRWNWHDGEVEMTVDPLNFPDLLSIHDHQTWTELPTKTVMGHIHLHVSELEKTEEFYVEGLWFEVVNRFGDQALFISDGKYHHHIGLNTWNGIGAPQPSLNSVGLKSFTIMVANEEKRMKIIDQLNKIGASIVKENGAFITQDPSGNRIILSVAKE
ncbi:glyoxalase [Bacillus sp. J14TS2]|uniref:VOC family protein n=1 Tax=Bacillus sp. J14TS2 TaxID=2807188 RepID=UPI001B017FF5|nr:VOC family protein [Bacillus sp. J14TS2]GIN72877.1 glyoxalase [Bacillus sp. J14TS2]